MVKSIIGASDPTFTPFSITILYGWVFYGLLSISSYWFDTFDIHHNVNFLPPQLELFAGLFIVLGAILMILSSRSWKKMNTAWTMDKIGMIIALGGWTCYMLGVGLADPTAIGRALFSVIFIVALIVRYILTYTYQQFIKARVAKLWKSGQALKH